MSESAEHAVCSTDGPRDALMHLIEMGVVNSRGSRPAEHRRNDTYFGRKKADTLVSNYILAESTTGVNALVDEHNCLQNQFKKSTDSTSRLPTPFTE